MTQRLTHKGVKQVIICPDCGNRNVKYQSETTEGSFYKCWRCESVFLVKSTIDFSPDDDCMDGDFDDFCIDDD